MDGADAIKYILSANIDGAIAECGVENARYEHIWIEELMKHNAVRDIYMYDTFAGLTEPGEHDFTCDNYTNFKMNKDDVYNTWKSNKVNDKLNNWCYVPLEQVKNKLNSTGYDQSRLHYVIGDVMETLKDKKNIPEKLAILRLDTDWYTSSKYELEQMYENVVTGGVIIFDDYYLWNGQRKATDEFFNSINVTYNFVQLNSQTAAIIKK
jgi:O-methyltransferase